jgi:hypothetical protein
MGLVTDLANVGTPAKFPHRVGAAARWASADFEWDFPWRFSHKAFG